jgi:hypothetical protein
MKKANGAYNGKDLTMPFYRKKEQSLVVLYHSLVSIVSIVGVVAALWPNVNKHHR